MAVRGSEGDAALLIVSVLVLLLLLVLIALMLVLAVLNLDELGLNGKEPDSVKQLRTLMMDQVSAAESSLMMVKMMVMMMMVMRCLMTPVARLPFCSP